jgi:hypothetical protein
LQFLSKKLHATVGAALLQLKNCVNVIGHQKRLVLPLENRSTIGLGRPKKCLEMEWKWK